MSKNKNYLLLKNNNKKDLENNIKLRNGIRVNFTINVESVNNISMNSVAGNEVLKQLLYTYGPIFVSIDTNTLKFYPSAKYKFFSICIIISNIFIYQQSLFFYYLQNLKFEVCNYLFLIDFQI